MLNFLALSVQYLIDLRPLRKFLREWLKKYLTKVGPKKSYKWSDMGSPYKWPKIHGFALAYNTAYRGFLPPIYNWIRGPPWTNHLILWVGEVIFLNPPFRCWSMCKKNFGIICVFGWGGTLSVSGFWTHFVGWNQFPMKKTHRWRLVPSVFFPRNAMVRRDTSSSLRASSRWQSSPEIFGRETTQHPLNHRKKLKGGPRIQS